MDSAVRRSALHTQVEKVRVEFLKWKDMLDNTNTAKNSEFPPLHKKLKESLASLQTDMTQLEGTVVMVEKAPHKFPHISGEELRTRRQFVDETKRGIAEMNSTYNSRRTAGKIDNDKRALLTARSATSAGSGSGARNPYGAAHDDFIGEQKQRQEMIRKQQEEHLDGLGESVDRLGAMASSIHVELAEQDRMLEELDRDVDEAQGSMDQAMKQIQKLLQTKDKCQLWTIFLLTITFLILTIVVFM